MNPSGVRTAFVDESLSNERRDPRAYILAAVISHESVLDDARASVADLLLRYQVKVRWHDEGEKRRRLIVEAIASMPLRHLVVVRSGQTGERVERRRQKSVERLLCDLQAHDVGRVTFESRGAADDRRDRNTTDGLRAQHALSSRVRVEHVAGRREPMLWVADAVCGATVQHRVGDESYLETIRAGADLEMIHISAS